MIMVRAKFVVMWPAALVAIALTGCTDKRNETYGPTERPKVSGKERPMTESQSLAPQGTAPSAAGAEGKLDAAPTTN